MTRKQFSQKKSFFSMYERGKTVLAGTTYQKDLYLGDFDYIKGFSIDFTGNLNCQTRILFNSQSNLYQIVGYSTTSNNANVSGDSSKISMASDYTSLQFINNDTADHNLNWGIFCK